MIIFVRHGQSFANLKRIFHDAPECELTELGKLQAKSAGKELGKMIHGEVVVYSSPYVRALQTCGIVLESSNIEHSDVIIDDRLRERMYTGLVGKGINSENECKDGISEEDYRRIWVYDDPTSASYGIETLEQLKERILGFLSDLSKEHQDKTIIIFSHKGVGMMMHALLDEWPDGGDFNKIPRMENAAFRSFVI